MAPRRLPRIFGGPSVLPGAEVVSQAVSFAGKNVADIGSDSGTVEATVILAAIVQKYELLLREDVDGTAPKGETFEQKRSRVTAADYTITLHPKPVAVVFRRRKLETVQ